MPTQTAPWVARGMPGQVVAEEVENLLRQGALPWEIADALGLQEDSILAALRRHGRDDLTEPFVAAREREKLTRHPPRHWSPK